MLSNHSTALDNCPYKISKFNPKSINLSLFVVVIVIGGCRVDVGVDRMNRINRTNGINGRMKAIASKHYLVMEMYQ